MITINGRFLCKRFATGTHRSSFFLMSHLCQLLDEYDIVCPRTPEMDLPAQLAPHVRVYNRYGLPDHAWEQVYFPSVSRSSIHLSLIGTGPFASRSCPRAMVVHDVNFHLIANSFDWRFRTWYHFACCWAAKAADIVFAVSQYTKNTLVEHAKIDPDKVHVFRQGPGLPAELLLDQANVTPPDRPFILCVGSLQPHKNLNGILKAFSLLRRSCEREVDLVIVGKKQNHFNDPQVSPKDLADPAIRFTGYISDKELVSLYHSAAAFVYPSFEEGFGMPIVEAFYARCPVITSTCSCLPEIAGDAAILVDPSDPQEIAAAMKCLLSEPSTRNAMIDRGVERSKRFQWPLAADSVLTKLRQHFGE
jgi:glycosyltransferase involved in cell wall biosynthesis